MLLPAAIRTPSSPKGRRPTSLGVRPIVGVVGALFIGFGIPVIPAAAAG